MSPILIVISAAFAIAGASIYIGSMVRGKTKPARMTRSVVLVIVLVGTIGLYANQDWPTFSLYVVYSIMNALILFFTLKYGMGGWKKIDIISLLIAITGIKKAAEILFGKKGE